MKYRLLALLFCLAPGSAFSVTELDWEVTARLPQSRDNFVQGLAIVGDYQYLSSGGYGSSSLRRYHFPGGELESQRPLPPQLFAEGLTVFGDRVYQLTWRAGAVLVYQRDSLQRLHHFRIPGEGWGLTDDGEQLIYSDGSDQLHFISPRTERITHSLDVTLNGEPLGRLNELEWVEGHIWANVWLSNHIVVIDPASGKVLATLNLAGLLPAEERLPDTDVLNGIARDPSDGAIWVTGKRWPWQYRLRVHWPEAEASGSETR